MNKTECKTRLQDSHFSTENLSYTRVLTGLMVLFTCYNVTRVLSFIVKVNG